MKRLERRWRVDNQLFVEKKRNERVCYNQEINKKRTPLLTPTLQASQHTVDTLASTLADPVGVLQFHSLLVYIPATFLLGSTFQHSNQFYKCLQLYD